MGVPILLLHGVGGGAWSWAPQRRRLAPTHRVGAWEARGHGRAAHVADAGLADYYCDAQEALSAALADAGRPVFVAGHSMGGLLAATLACDYPRDVAGLFLVDPVYATGDGTYAHVPAPLARPARMICAPLIGSILRGGVAGRSIARAMFERSFHDRERMEEAWTQQQLQQPLEYRRMLLESFEGPTGFPLRDVAREIVCPTVVVEAAPDLAHPRFPRLTETLRERLGSRFEHLAVDGGHYLQLDCPELVTAALERFLTFVGATVQA